MKSQPDMAFDKGKAWEYLATRIAKKKHKRRRRQQFILVAGCVLLIGSFFKFGVLNVRFLFETKYVEYSTGAGEIKKLLLPDGSQIQLNSMSQIRYPEKFSSNKRDIELLAGEALFDVVKDPNSPFRVAYGSTQVQVLGTVFNVNAYDSTLLYVTLKEGSIQFVDNNFKYRLSPDERLSYSQQLKKATVERVSAVQDLAWKDQQWSFQNKTVDVVLRQIAAAQQMKFVKKDTGKKYPLISISHPKSPETLLPMIDMISEVGKVHVQIQDNTIVLN